MKDDADLGSPESNLFSSDAFWVNNNNLSTQNVRISILNIRMIQIEDPTKKTLRFLDTGYLPIN
jgi:hypothetical protein